jgi:hypothetical protein
LIVVSALGDSEVLRRGEVGHRQQVEIILHPGKDAALRNDTAREGRTCGGIFDGEGSGGAENG